MSDSRTSSRTYYERAAAFAPPVFAGRLSGAVVNGYWIDSDRYFFCVGEADADGVIGYSPKIADARVDTVEPVVSRDRLATLIAGYDERPIDASALAAATYDMPDAETLVVTLNQQAYHIGICNIELLKTGTIDPTPSLHSPDGRFAAFPRDHAILLKDRETGAVRQLSSDGTRHYAYGVMPESAILPLAVGRAAIPDGLWSSDSQWFATCRIDERHLPESGLVEHVPAGGGRAVAHVFKVSSPDTELATAKFVAFHVPSGRSVDTAGHPFAVQLGSAFSMRQCWFAGDHLYAFNWGRYADEVSLIELSLKSGSIRTVLCERTVSGWIDAHPSVVGQPVLRILPDSRELIWYSDADGYAHLYLHDLITGKLKNRITQGPWMVRDILHVDPVRRRILFLASGFDDIADLGQRRLCAIDFDGGRFERFDLGGGDMAAHPDPVAGIEQCRPYRPSYAPSSASPDGRHVVLQLGSADRGSRTLMVEVSTGDSIELARDNSEALWTAPLPQPFTVLAADGVTPLHGALYSPTDFDPAKSYPLVDYIYPGPQVNWFSRRLATSTSLTAQSVAELGMIGLVLETRGMPHRSRAFHQAGKGRLHEPQLADHIAAIEQLCGRHSFLDRNRIGIFGQSGGGYAAARALFDYPDTFKAGVSICGSHDSRNYVAHWIDKYGGRPGSIERDDQSNNAAAHRLEGRLLLIHGDMDDNVHVAHTLALSAALIAAGKEFDQLIVPNATHGVLQENAYVLQRLWNFLMRHLIGVEPPAEQIPHWTQPEYVAAMTRHLAAFP